MTNYESACRKFRPGTIVKVNREDFTHPAVRCVAVAVERYRDCDDLPLICVAFPSVMGCKVAWFPADDVVLGGAG